MGFKTGTSMGGSIEYTRTKNKQAFINKIDNVKKKNAKVCIDCEDNKEGYCGKYKGWCGKVNFRCNGETMSYQDKLQLNKYNNQKKKKKKSKSKSKVKKIQRKSKF